MTTPENSPPKKTRRKASPKPAEAKTPADLAKESADRLSAQAETAANVQAQAEAAKEPFDVAKKGVDQAELKGAELAAKVRSGEMTVADILAMDSESDREAAEIQIRKFLDVKKVQVAAAEESEAARRFFVKCTRCGGPGIFLLKNPWVGSIGPKEWFSAYKSKDSHYPANEIICQCCALEGKRTKLRLTILAGGQFSPYKRVRMEAHDMDLGGH